MRISDWSSDVCSSDLLRAQAKSLYYEWVVLEKKKAVLEENRQIIETMLKLARIRYPYSQGSLGSIYKAEGRLHEVENMILMTGSGIVEKNIRLRSEEHTSELQSLMRISYAVFCLKKKTTIQ